VPLLATSQRLCSWFSSTTGLVLCTYGSRNNCRGDVRAQIDAGVAAVIVDHVAYVVGGLEQPV
jgi:glycerophosphoryl diester phosphodiesterase